MAHYATSSTERPTLPPLHSLHLPMAQKSLAPQGVSYENCTPQPLPRLYVPQHMHRSRQVSISSSTTSRSPSPPTPSSSSFPAALGLNAKVRLVPCAFDAADAIVVVSPPCASMRDVTNATPLDRAKQGQALLLVGTALQQFRRPDRKLAKGARIHPYKIVRSADAARRT